MGERRPQPPAWAAGRAVPGWVLAAAGLVALDEMVERLPEDHANARRLAEGLAELPGVQIDPMQVRTNIVIFALEHPKLQPAELVSRLDADGVRVLAIGGKRLRAVTHYEVDRAGIERSLVAFGAQLRA